MSSSVRQRSAAKDKKRGTTPEPDSVAAVGETIKKEVQNAGNATKDAVKTAASKEWDYKVALLVLTALAFLTRFYRINHPNEVVFDEVHFGKV